jgi:hypothetical protein
MVRVETSGRLRRVEFFGILRCAQDDGRNRYSSVFSFVMNLVTSAWEIASVV